VTFRIDHPVRLSAIHTYACHSIGCFPLSCIRFHSSPDDSGTICRQWYNGSVHQSKEGTLNGIKRLMCAAICFAACSNPTTPSENTHEWEDYEWVPCADLFSDPCSVLCSVSGDSLYIMVTQVADTTEWYRCQMPDLVTFNVYSGEHFGEDYYVDGNRAMTVSGSLLTDDFFEYYSPYGLSDGRLGESIPYQPDTALGGVNNVHAVFFGEVDGDSTLVYRKAFSTGDSQWDLTLAHDSTFQVMVYLQWGEPGDSLCFFANSGMMPVFLGSSEICVHG